MQNFNLEFERTKKTQSKKAADKNVPYIADLTTTKHEFTKQYIGQTLYIKPTMVVSVPTYDTEKNYFSAERLENQKNLKDNKHKNKLSPKAIMRIKNAINWLVVSAKDKKVYNKQSGKTFNFKVNLITLTLPDTLHKLSDNEFKKNLLHPFLVYMKKYYGLKNYVWKVEFQKNGKLHLHITTDTFISLYILRHYWNSLLEKNNYLEEFKKKYKHNNPNSTDIHAVWKVKNLGAYLAKYLSKNEDSSETINGRIWGCNYELSDKNKCILELHRDEVGEHMKCLMHKEINFKEVTTQSKKTGLFYTSCEVFFIKLFQWNNIISGKIREVYDKHRFEIRNQFKPLNLVYEV